MQKLMVLSLLFLAILTSCNKDDDVHKSDVYPNSPYVHTKGALNIGEYWADLTAEVQDEGTYGVIEYGFFIGEDPDRVDNKLSAVGDAKDFVIRPCRLKSNTTYYYRAFIANGNGICLGKEIMSFTTKRYQLYNEEVLVQGGSFMMGSEDHAFDESPVHKVALNSFFMQRKEISTKHYSYYFRDAHHDMTSTKEFDVALFGATDYAEMTYLEAEDFIVWYNARSIKTYRMPTEAEWEYAARGGIKSKGYTYAGSDNISLVAWYRDNYDEMHSGKELKSNELFIYNMSGSLSEWCSDWYDPNYYKYSEVVNPKGPLEACESLRHVVRGGSYKDPAYACRTTIRFYGGMDIKHGLRLVTEDI